MPIDKHNAQLYLRMIEQIKKTMTSDSEFPYNRLLIHHNFVFQSLITHDIEHHCKKIFHI